MRGTRRRSATRKRVSTSLLVLTLSLLAATNKYNGLVHARVSASESEPSEQALDRQTEASFSPPHTRRKLSELLGEEDKDEDGLFRVIVKYKNELGRVSIEEHSEAWRQGMGLESLHSIAAKVTLEELQVLEEDDNIEAVEQNYRLYPLGVRGGRNANAPTGEHLEMEIQKLRQRMLNGGEIIPYGLDLIRATSDELPSPAEREFSDSCRDPNAFRIGIVDSGIDVSNPDIPCKPINDRDTNCIGESFGLEDDEADWFTDQRGHGTHVAGTIGALGGNGLGVKGVIGDQGICYIIAKVFGLSGGADLDVILDAIEYTVRQGATVVNMSLGGGGYSQESDQFYERWRNRGVLFFAASGNEGANGVSSISYPASYAAVISVAAVDENSEIADFSTFNSYVDIAAPGVAVLSTFPLGLGGVATVTGDDFGVSGGAMQYSVLPDDEGITGVLVECPNLGQDECPPAPSGEPHICVIERGEIFFEEKALNCQRGGGVAAVVYNNVPGLFNGALDPDTDVEIPVIGMSLDDGNAILSQLIPEVEVEATLSVQDGYTFQEGTSMACPHAAGGAALLWRECTECFNYEIAICMEKTAVDLGEKGKDDYYGSGLIQLDEAYKCLRDTAGCCRDSDPSTRTGPPSSAPTFVLSDVPSSVPSDVPSTIPSMAASILSISSPPSISTAPSVSASPSMASEKSGAPSSVPTLPRGDTSNEDVSLLPV